LRKPGGLAVSPALASKAMASIEQRLVALMVNIAASAV
jgi:hypothetical protein